MSSPHLGGDFLTAIASGGSRGGSGRNTPINTGSPLRSIPAQLAYARPQVIAAPQVLSDDDDDDMRVGGGGWRPITPSRASPRQTDHQLLHHHQPSSSHQQQQPQQPQPIKVQRGPSSRTINDDIPIHVEPYMMEYNDPSLLSPTPPEDHPYEDEPSSSVGEVHFADLPPVLKGYLLGQIACVVKFGVWWVGFTYLILALFGGSSYLVGGTRICFNLALLLCSPMAGGIAEKTNIKKLLNKTVLVRGLIYVLAIPVAWVLMDSELLWSAHTALHTSFFIVFLLIIFIDGIGVAFSNVADIDSGGVNLVAAQYGIEIDDNIRNYFNSLHIMFFDLSMVVFNPILAYVGLFIGQHTVSEHDDDGVGNVVDEVTLLIAIGGVFLISTIMTLICYNAYMPDLPASSSSDSPPPNGSHSMQTFSSVNGDLNTSLTSDIVPQEPEPLSWAQFKELAISVKEGAGLTWANTRIRYRVLFFAIETSVEDAMIALIAAEIGSEVFAPADSTLHYAWGNLWGAGLVACGKSGGVLASILMHRYFTIDPNDPDPSRAYKPLFWFAFFGGCFSLILPIAYHFRLNGGLSDTLSTILMFGAMFLFFLFSTLSKIGFSTLMQSMAAEVEATGRVFGFVAAFVTATDALLLMGMSALFSAIGLELALWIACAFIAVHGLIELLFGPGLVLKHQPTSLDEQLRQDLSQPLM